MYILGSQSSVPTDPNGVFWLAQKRFPLFAFEALVVLLVDAMNGGLTYKDLIKLTLSCPKWFHQNVFAITSISPSFTRVGVFL